MSGIKKISIITPCFNEAENIPELYERLTKIIKTLPYEYEIIFVDNASSDNSLQMYEKLVETDSHVHVLFMSRNFGSSQPSFLAGLRYATGDGAILIESDLQDPPELIPQLIEKWEQGFDVVYTTHTKRKGTPFRRIFYKIFYIIFHWFSYLDIPVDSGDFSLLDRKVIDVIKQLPEKDVYIRGLRTWAGFKQTNITYVRDARAYGTTKISFFENFTWFRKAIFNFSYRPLELISGLAIMTMFATICAAFIYLYIFFKHDMPRGFPTLLMVMFIFGSIQLLALGTIGEYLMRMFQEIKGRPPYIIARVLHKKAPCFANVSKDSSYLHPRTKSKRTLDEREEQ